MTNCGCEICVKCLENLIRYKRERKYILCPGRICYKNLDVEEILSVV